MEVDDCGQALQVVDEEQAGEALVPRVHDLEMAVLEKQGFGFALDWVRSRCTYLVLVDFEAHWAHYLFAQTVE